MRFFIPTHWNEEYEDAGGGTFYEIGDDTGTLRLNVLSFLMENDILPEKLLSIIEGRKIKNDGKVEVLSDGRFLLKYSIKSKKEEGLLIFFWEVAKLVSPRNYNIAVFSFTIMAKQSESETMLNEISSIEKEVKKVHFGMYS